MPVLKEDEIIALLEENIQYFKEQVLPKYKLNDLGPLQRKHHTAQETGWIAHNLCGLSQTDPRVICKAMRQVDFDALCNMLGFIDGHTLLDLAPNLAVACYLHKFNDQQNADLTQGQIGTLIDRFTSDGSIRKPAHLLMNYHYGLQRLLGFYRA